MKNIQILLLCFLTSMIAFSCEKDIILDIPAGEIDGVVEGWIYEDSGPLVIYSKQFSGYGSFNYATLSEDLNVKNAIIKVSENNGPKVILVEQSIFELPMDLVFQAFDSYRFPRGFALILPLLAGLTIEQQEAAINAEPSLSLEIKEIIIDFLPLLNSLNFYVDTTNTIIGHGGSSYQLEIESEGKFISSETTIPVKQDINFLSYEINQDKPNLAQVKINVTVPSNSDAFILLATKRNFEPFYVPQFLGGGLSDNGIYAGSGTITLPLLRGVPENDTTDISELGLFEVGDEVTLKWQNIDEATYNFWFSLFNDGGDTPFSAATLIQTNINNGFGIWAGYNTSYSTITIQ